MSVLKNFHHRFFGSSEFPKLVFLHGLMGYSANWNRIANSLSDRFHILVFDQRGHGRSFKPNSGFTPQDYANDLKDILNSISWPKVSLVGHSMGGRNAANFTRRYPECVEKLVIEDIGPIAQNSTSNLALEILSKVPTPFPDKESAKKFIDQNFQPSNLADFIASNLEEKSPNEWNWRFSEVAIEQTVKASLTQDQWEDFDQLQVRSLLVRGQNSKDLPKGLFDEICARNHLIKGQEIIGAGHWVHFEKPSEFTQVLKDFL